MDEANGSPEAATDVRCAECNSLLRSGQDRVETADGVFCRLCYDRLSQQLEEAIRAQGTDINYGQALMGALLGGGLGVAAWWGFTVLTGWSLGLVAIVIGIAVGKGTNLFAGGKRGQGLQVMSTCVAGLSFVYATYLVNRTFFQRGMVEDGTDVVLPLLPDPQLFFVVLSAGFSLFDLIFLAIVLWEAWRIPAPLTLPAAGGAP